MIGTLRRELFGRLLIVNEHHLRQVLTEYLQHCNTARPHRALGQLVPDQAGTRLPRINIADVVCQRARGRKPRKRPMLVAGDSRAPDLPETDPRWAHARVPDPANSAGQSGVLTITELIYVSGKLKLQFH
jgi:hypothetical protein